MEGELLWKPVSFNQIVKQKVLTAELFRNLIPCVFQFFFPSRQSDSIAACTAQPRALLLHPSATCREGKQVPSRQHCSTAPVQELGTPRLLQHTPGTAVQTQHWGLGIMDKNPLHSYLETEKNTICSWPALTPYVSARGHSWRLSRSLMDPCSELKAQFLCLSTCPCWQADVPVPGAVMLHTALFNFPLLFSVKQVTDKT